MGKCTVDNCDKSSRAEKGGLCWMHYLRKWRHGDVNHKERAANNEPSAWIREVALHYAGDDCLTWPHATMSNGYGSTLMDGRNQPAHRVVCKLAHGNPPTKRHYACHECGNGHLGCVNPKHLSWKTPKQNCEDTLKHGTRNRGERQGHCKLTESNVREIRILAGQLTQKEIGERFGVTRMTVSAIITRANWYWLD